MTGRLTARLADWPAIRRSRADCGTGTGYSAATRRGAVRQIVHLHGAAEAELCLTWPVIDRLEDTLRREGSVDFQPGDDWVRVHLDTESEIALTLALTSLALQATAESDVRMGLPPCSCRTIPSRR